MTEGPDDGEHRDPKRNSNSRTLEGRTQAGFFEVLMNPKVFLAVLAIVLVFGVALIVGTTAPPANGTGLKQVKYQIQGQDQVVVLKPISSDALEGARYVFGDQNAPVTIVEFADYQCPACGVFANQVETQLEEKLVQTGKARYVFRDFPLSIHPNAPAAALAAACVNAQAPNRFREFHKLLFQLQAEWSSLEPKRALQQIVGYSKLLELDQPKLETCIATNETQADIQKDMAVGTKIQLSGTPSFVFISKKGSFLMAGAMPIEGFQAVLDELQ
jgi:protein-disulfide isomerase